MSFILSDHSCNIAKSLGRQQWWCRGNRHLVFFWREKNCGGKSLKREGKKCICKHFNAALNTLGLFLCICLAPSCLFFNCWRVFHIGSWKQRMLIPFSTMFQKYLQLKVKIKQIWWKAPLKQIELGGWGIRHWKSIFLCKELLQAHFQFCVQF